MKLETQEYKVDYSQVLQFNKTDYFCYNSENKKAFVYCRSFQNKSFSAFSVRQAVVYKAYLPNESLVIFPIVRLNLIILRISLLDAELLIF